MPVLELTFEEAERLLSIMRSNNHILKNSGEWPERPIDRSVEKKLFELSMDRMRNSVERIEGACQKNEV